MRPHQVRVILTTATSKREYFLDHPLHDYSQAKRESVCSQDHPLLQDLQLCRRQLYFSLFTSRYHTQNTHTHCSHTLAQLPHTLLHYARPCTQHTCTHHVTECKCSLITLHAISPVQGCTPAHIHTRTLYVHAVQISLCTTHTLMSNSYYKSVSLINYHLNTYSSNCPDTKHSHTILSHSAPPTSLVAHRPPYLCPVGKLQGHDDDAVHMRENRWCFEW